MYLVWTLLSIWVFGLDFIEYMGIWFGLYWVLSSFFDHYYIFSSVQFRPLDGRRRDRGLGFLSSLS